ncbi:MAG: Eco57I restriction-modification methylase domain-containing protein [Candidatus Hodarchaeales archaeon]|jgi:adenine-specific DNA-methyltransferase
MSDQWKNLLILLSKIRDNFLSASSPIDGSNREFINQYIMQLAVLWGLQKNLYFNNDENFFTSMFHLIEKRDPRIPYNTYNNFMNSLLLRLSTLNDNHICIDSHFGRLRGCKSAIFIDIKLLQKKSRFPNNFFSSSDSSTNVIFGSSGLLTVLDQIKFDKYGVFLGSLYEWLISSKKKRVGGVYYSPVELTVYISRYSVRTALMDQMGLNDTYSQETWTTFIKSLDKNGTLRLYEALRNLTVLDPAVGTGQFLESVVDELLVLYSLIIEKARNLDESITIDLYTSRSQEICETIDLTKIKDTAEIEFYILMHLIFPKALYGVDIDPSVIPFTKARFFLYIALRVKKIKTNLSYNSKFQCNLKIGDALLLDWENLFPEMLKKPRFSLILTNPPYIGESDNKEIFRKYSVALPTYYEGKLDIWYLFFQLAINLAKPRGIVSFLATSYWLTASGASKLRKRIFEETFILEFIDFGDNRLFEGAHGIHSSILTVKKLEMQNPSINCVFYTNIISQREKLLDKMSDQLIYQINQKNLTLNDWDDYFHFLPADVSFILKKLTKVSTPIRESTYRVKEGLITGLNKITKRQIEKYGYPTIWENRGIFVFDLNNVTDQNNIKTFTNDEKKYLRPLYKSSSIRPYSTRVYTERRVLYLVRKEVDLSMVPNIKNHLDHYQIAMENSLDHPPYINRPRKKEMFLSPKLITPQRARKTHFAYSCTEWFAAQDVYFIQEARNSTPKLKALLLLLQSKVSFYWFSWMGKKKGSQLEFFGESLSNFPIPKILNNHVLLARIADYLIFLHSLEKITNEFQPIIMFLEERVAKVMVYVSYFEDQILTSSNQNQLFKDVCDFLHKSLPQINIERFLRIQYSIFLTENTTTVDKSEFSDIRNGLLKKIEKAFQIIQIEENLQKLYTLIMLSPIVRQIENYFDLKDNESM